MNSALVAHQGVDCCMAYEIVMEESANGHGRGESGTGGSQKGHHKGFIPFSQERVPAGVPSEL